MRSNLKRFLLLLALLLIAFGLWKWWQKPPQGPPPKPPASTDTADSGTRPATLDEALEIARERLQAMEDSLVDYQGRMTKRELVGGQLQPENEMAFKIRARRPDQPMAVYLRFLRPDSMAGREAIWRENVSEGKLVVHETGVLGMLPIPPLDPNGFLAMQGNRYPITQIGFKNLVLQLLQRGKQIEALGGADVTFQEGYQVGDRQCLLIQVRPKFEPSQQAGEGIEFSLAEIAIDMERQIPLRYAAYGPPEDVGQPLQLQEEYVYYDVVLNPGLSDNDFDPKNPEYDYP